MLALLFSGQGAQNVGMMRDIASACPSARQIFEEANDVLGRDIADICWNSSQEDLDQTENTQPAIVTAQVAVLRALQDRCIPVEVVAGFSLGEWSALTAVNALMFDDLLPLVALRAEAMQGAVPKGKGAMAAIMGVDAVEVEALCTRFDGVWPSNYNCPGQTTVAGTSEGIETLLKAAEDTGVMATRIAVSIPSHCPLMLLAAKALEPKIEQAPFSDAQLPLVMNVTADVATAASDIRRSLIQQLTHPVLFEQSIRFMFDQGVDTFIEVGPGKVLGGFVRRTAKRAEKKVRVYRADSLKELDRAVDEIGQH